jgi:hypothetical protein
MIVYTEAIEIEGNITSTTAMIKNTMKGLGQQQYRPCNQERRYNMYPLLDLEISKARQRAIMAEIEHDRLVRLVKTNSKSVSKGPGLSLALGSLVLSTLVLVHMLAG